MSTFSSFDLLPSLQRTLKSLELTQPTEIQEKAIPLLIEGKSLVGISETGSGKTLSYALPVMSYLKKLENDKDGVKNDGAPRAVVMVPTRELGEQVSKVFKKFTHDTRLRVRPVLGGMNLEQARRNVSGQFEILIATPGRLRQLLDKKALSLSDVRILIFDEADQMLDQGFLTDSNAIVEVCKKDLQLGLFSATVSESVQALMNQLFSKAEVIRSSGSGKVVKSLVTKNIIVKDGNRWPHMQQVMEEPSKGVTLIFTNTRDQCDKIAKELNDNDYPCSIYRGEMDRNDRRQNLKKFRDGTIDILVATDVAGRGLDVENIERVINYHLPKEVENYLHRVGRTARAGRKGLVINFVTERDQPLMNELKSRK